jgi:hypothetical protein
MIKFEKIAVAIGIMYDGGQIEPEELVESIDIKDNEISINLSGYDENGEFHRTFNYKFDVTDPDTKTLTGD